MGRYKESWSLGTVQADQEVVTSWTDLLAAAGQGVGGAKLLKRPYHLALTGAGGGRGAAGFAWNADQTAAELHGGFFKRGVEVGLHIVEFGMGLM